MRTTKLNSPVSMFALILLIALAIVLSVATSEVHAQEGNPPTIEPQIIGGGPAVAGEWPWQVALVDGSATDLFQGQFCGGSLIHPQWVVTAAHCITEQNGSVSAASTVDIVAGIYDLGSPAAGYQRRDVTQIIRHSSYNDSTLDNDIALLKLASPVTIGGSGETSTDLIRLAPASLGNWVGVNSWATGWGQTQENPAGYPTQLYEVQLPIYANSVCGDASHWGGGITDNKLCAGRDIGGISVCFGDSGGPLVVPDGGGGWYLAGISSYVSDLGCGTARLPSVFARVSRYGDWVNQNIGLTTLVSPSGGIGTNYNPTYTWNAVPTMTYYYLYVNGPSGNVIAQWYTPAQAGCSSGTGTCSVTPSTTLAGGAHRWWVQTWNPAGYGPWSIGKDFTTTLPPAPGKATLSSPNGSITSNNPTYTWNKVSDATWYNLYVSGPSGYVFSQWYSAADVCGASTCSVANATTLGVGAHQWWIQTWNGTGGYGPWSTGMSFSLAAPGAATLNTPNGSTSNNPTYNWNKVSGATWYNLYVSGPSGYVFSQWYAASVCGASTCSAPGATNGLASGQYRWWVQTWNNVGYGPWSSGQNFSVP